MTDDLFAQAVTLATLDKYRPKQANLRRAISAAYYAVFHCLVEEACVCQLGAQHSQTPLRNVLARAYSHSVMKAACKSFGGGALKNAAAKGLPTSFMIPREIREVAAHFVELQEKRHLADYDRTEAFLRSDVLVLIEQARLRIRNFVNAPSSNEKRFFLACLWAWKDLANR